MTRALVTGGAGFLGSHLCARLLEEGLDVIGMDNLLTGSLDNLVSCQANPRFQFIHQDVIEPFTLNGPLAYVFHLASPASPVDFTTKAKAIMKVNAWGTERALDVARDKQARFFFASTSEVYGDPLIHPQPEEYWGNVNPIGIRGVYDELKRYGEAMTMTYRRYYDVDTKIVRIFNTYGPAMRLDDGRVVPNFIGQALRGEPITVYGTGTQTRSFCYVSDLIDGFWRLINSEQSGPINIGNPTERTMLEFAQEIKALTRSASPIVYEPLKTADDPKQRRPDITKAQQLLGWEPKVSLEDGLQRTIAYFQTRV